MFVRYVSEGLLYFLELYNNTTVQNHKCPPPCASVNYLASIRSEHSNTCRLYFVADQPTAQADNHLNLVWVVLTALTHTLIFAFIRPPEEVLPHTLRFLQ